MSKSQSHLLLTLCALSVISLSGCRSGFRSLSDSKFGKDPFLTDDKVELVSGSLEDVVTKSSDAVASVAKEVESFGDAAQDSASEVAEQLAAEFDEGMASAQSNLSQATTQSISAAEAALFEPLPGNPSATAPTAPSEILQAGFQADVPPDPGPEIQSIPAPSRVANSGLGSASPWGSLPVGNSGRGVELSFEEGDEDDRVDINPNEFPIQLDNFPGDSITPFPPDPPMDSEVRPEKSDESWASRFRRGRLNLFGGDDRPAETIDAVPVPVPEPETKPDRKSIRDHFSRLGARFGLGDDEEVPEAPSVMATETTQHPAHCIDDLIAQTQTRLAGVNYTALNPVEQEQYLRDQVNLRLFYLANNQNERALDAIPSIPPAEQEFWQQMFWSLSQYRNSDGVPDKTERITQTVAQLRTALQRLQETARLQLRNVSFCQRITGYGNYERFAKDVFKPGEPVLVYAEIENFRSQPTTSGQYRTVLRSTLQILPEDRTGRPLDSVVLRPVEDVCRNARRDYFNSYEFTIPNDIKPGRYVLEITVDDRLSGKSAQQSVLFSVP